MMPKAMIKQAIKENWRRAQYNLNSEEPLSISTPAYDYFIENGTLERSEQDIREGYKAAIIYLRKKHPQYEHLSDKEFKEAVKFSAFNYTKSYIIKKLYKKLLSEKKTIEDIL